jgi:hypothetical protein
MLRRLQKLRSISKHHFSSKTPGDYEDYFLSRKQRLVNPAPKFRRVSIHKELEEALPSLSKSSIEYFL